jgi:hypothetical protein
VLIDGFYLRLVSGTGVATYARNLTYPTHEIGYETDVLYDVRATGWGFANCCAGDDALPIDSHDIRASAEGIGELDTSADLQTAQRPRMPAGQSVFEAGLPAPVACAPRNGPLADTGADVPARARGDVARFQIGSCPRRGASPSPGCRGRRGAKITRRQRAGVNGLRSVAVADWRRNGLFGWFLVSFGRGRIGSLSRGCIVL